jgi:hypothetical protein
LAGAASKTSPTLHQFRLEVDPSIRQRALKTLDQTIAKEKK